MRSYYNPRGLFAGRTVALLSGMLAGGWLATDANAGPLRQPRHLADYHVDSGVHTVTTGTEPVSVFRTVVEATGAPWLWLHFSSYELGQGSFIQLISLQDGGMQRLNARSLPVWNNSSAVFNGGAVELELFAAPGDQNVFVRITQITVGEWAPVVPVAESTGGKLPGDDDQESLCGSDNRVASTDNRVGRLYFGGCTAWRTSSGAFLTAGHCVDFDPDQGGPGLPDGVLDLSGVVEFNVPASLANGTTVAANPDDQYPILTANVFWRFDGEGQGLGKDWAVFRVGPNANTGLMPHEAYGGFFRMTRESPAASATMRITGFGLDNTPVGSTGNRNAQNFTNQTDTGPYIGESSSGLNIWHEYQVDTTGGNSGSPIIWNTNGLTIGIHTNAGCGASTGNTGTSFEVDALETALRNSTSSLARFVDVGHPLPVVADGTIFRPFGTVTAGVNAVSSGGVVSIVAGNYTAAAGNTFTIGADGKSMTFDVPVGSVTIGN